ncbi:hypothetical protein Tco_0146075 [Tanacetum coccineum]
MYCPLRVHDCVVMLVLKSRASHRGLMRIAVSGKLLIPSWKFFYAVSDNQVYLDIGRSANLSEPYTKILQDFCENEVRLNCYNAWYHLPVERWLADVVPEDCIIHLIGEKFVALFHLELEMNHVMMKHFDDFECRAFQVFGSEFKDSLLFTIPIHKCRHIPGLSNKRVSPWRRIMST